MNSERKAFCEYIKNEYNDDNPIEWLDGKPIKGLHMMLWNAWQASAQRQGYKLVSTETIRHAIGWAYVAKWDSASDEDEQEIKHHENILRDMIGSVDE